MNKYGVRTADTNTYYNDHHQHLEVLSFRKNFIFILEIMRKRTRVWKILIEEEEENMYLEKGTCHLLNVLYL